MSMCALLPFAQLTRLPACLLKHVLYIQLLLTVAVCEARDGCLLDDCGGVNNNAQPSQELLQA